MALRTINDIEISPAGDRIAYTVSTPSVARNAHEPALFVIPAAGGAPKQLADGYKIFTPALPAPRLRWRADGQAISVLVAEKTGPQVLTITPDNTNAQVVTSAPLGVSGYEWSPDGKYLAYLTRDPGPSTPPIANKVGAHPPATRLWLQPLNPARPGTRGHARHSIRRQLLVVAGQQGDCLLVGAGRRISRAVSDQDLRGCGRRRRNSADHRPRRHECVAAVLA